MPLSSPHGTGPIPQSGPAHHRADNLVEKDIIGPRRADSDSIRFLFPLQYHELPFSIFILPWFSQRLLAQLAVAQPAAPAGRGFDPPPGRISLPAEKKTLDVLLMAWAVRPGLVLR